MKYKLIGVIFGVLGIFTTCNDPMDSPEYFQLQKDLENTRIKIAKMENSPEWRFKQALELKRNGNHDQALKSLEMILAKHPTSVLNKIIQKEIYDLKARSLLKTKEIDQAIQSRFFELTEQKKVALDSITITVRKIEARKRWRHDKYGKKAHTTKAGKGSSYLTVETIIYSKSENPKLPALSIYKLDGRKLTFVESLKYRFNRWGNYNFYLGNEVDPSNNFSQSSSVKFMPAALLSDDLIKEEILFLVAKKQTCVVRKEDRFNHPPSSYEDTFCKYPKQITAEELKANFSLLKILKNGK